MCQVTGFTDVAPVVREQTVKAVLAVISKLSDRTINGELLRFLARTANDEQPGIRTNTTICLGKIAKYLGQSVRRVPGIYCGAFQLLTHELLNLVTDQSPYRCFCSVFKGPFRTCKKCWPPSACSDNRCFQRRRLCNQDSSCDLPIACR